MNPLVEQLTQKFVDHYYPTMIKHGVMRPRRELRTLTTTMHTSIVNNGVMSTMRAITRNYQKHLGEEIGEREAQDFILSVKELLAEITLTEGS